MIAEELAQKKKAQEKQEADEKAAKQKKREQEEARAAEARRKEEIMQNTKREEKVCTCVVPCMLLSVCPTCMGVVRRHGYMSFESTLQERERKRLRE
jgi:hypothetical protein